MPISVRKQIAQLDPHQDYEKIAHLLASYEFPWDIEKALEFALFRTYAVPSISSLLYKTREFVDRPRKRYDDTELILYEIQENGFDSERGRKALRRMNQMHGRFNISNEDFLYVLSTFVFEPIRWLDRFGWRPMSEKEKIASFNYYRELGRRMNIQNIPTDMDVFEQYNIEYEKKHFRYTESNHQVGVATRNLFLGFYLPRFLWPLGKPFVYALMDEPLLKAFNFPLPHPWMRNITEGLLRFRARILRHLPRRKKPYLGTKVKRPTYPEGYKIEELDTFGQVVKK